MLNLNAQQILDCLRGNGTEEAQQQLDAACAESPMMQALNNLFKLILHNQDNQGMITVADAKELATASGDTVMLLLGEINRLQAHFRADDAAPGYYNAKHDPEKFNALIEEYHALPDKKTDYAFDLVAKALTVAPHDLSEAMHNKMMELDLFPPVLLVDDSGQALFTAEQVADKFGIPVEEVIERITQLQAEDPETFLVGTIHKLH